MSEGDARPVTASTGPGEVIASPGPSRQWRCPVCGAGTVDGAAADPLTGMVTGTCGHVMYAGYVAELDHLQQRAAWLVERVRGAEPAPPPDLAQAYGVWDVRGASPVPSGRAPSRGGGAGLPTVLLALGALLLAVAAVVFTAVAWPRLGPTGQVLLVLAATAAAVSAAIRLRHRLRGTAEAFAALSVGLALVTAAAAPALGLLPRAWAGAEAGYWSVVLLVLGAVAVSASHRWSLRAWAWLGWGVVAAGVAVTAGTVADALGAGAAVSAGAAGLAAVAGVAISTSSWWAQDGRDDRGPSVVAGCGLVLGAGAVVAAVALSREAVLAAAGAGALTAVALLVADRRVPVARAARSAPGPLGGAGLVLLAAAAGVALAVPTPRPVVAVLASTLGAVLLATGLRVGHVRLALAAAVAVWLCWWCVASASALVGGASEAPGAHSAAGFLTVVGLSLVLTAWGGRDDDLVRLVAWPGAVALFTAFVLLAPDGYPEVIEAWSLPLAGLLAMAGVVSCTGREVSTAQRWGPAVAVALLPSALATWGAPWVNGEDLDTVGWPLLRLVLVLVVSAAVLVLGVRLHSLGLVVPAAAAVLLAGLAQLWTGLQALPRWLALALVGAALVAAGARFEWVRAEGRRARGWLRELR